MSELPNDLRELLAEGRRALEPDAARLNAVYQRVLRTPAVPSEFDLPPRVGKTFAWSWLGAGGAALVGVALWLGAPQERPALHAAPTVIEAPAVEAAPAPRVEVAAVPARKAAAVRAREVTPPTPQLVPSSDWPVAKRESQRAKRERHHVAPVPAPLVEPVLPATVETSDAAPVHEETPPASVWSAGVTSAPREADGAASLRDEVQLIARARKALDKGDWAAAQRALDAHLMAHPVGQLHVERRALLLRARCLAGDLAAARRLHSELLTLAPGSSLVRSVERTCPQLAR